MKYITGYIYKFFQKAVISTTLLGLRLFIKSHFLIFLVFDKENIFVNKRLIKTKLVVSKAKFQFIESRTGSFISI